MCNPYHQDYFDLRMLVKQMRLHQIEGVCEGQTFKEWSDKNKYYKKLVDEFVFGNDSEIPS